MKHILSILPSGLASSLRWLGRNWWIWPTIGIVLGLGSAVLIATKHYGAGDTLSDLYLLVLILSVLLLVYGLFRHKASQLKRFIIPFAINLMVFILMLLASLPSALQSYFCPPADPFGKEHPIPEGFAYNEPITAFTATLDPVEEPVDSTDESTHLQVWVGGQGGLYKYNFYASNLPAGKVWLKAYEATENIPLTDRHGSRTGNVRYSEADIDGCHHFKRVVKKQEFMIQDGDMGDYYAVRLEVWFKDSKTRKERKLMDKVYRMEGWQR